MAGQQGQTSIQQPTQGLGFAGFGRGITTPPQAQSVPQPIVFGTQPQSGFGQIQNKTPQQAQGQGLASVTEPQPQPAPVVDPVVEADIGQALGGFSGPIRGRGGQARNPLRQTAPQAPNQPLAQAITVPLQQQALAQSMGQTNSKSPQLGQSFDLGGFESLFGQGFNIPDFGMGLSSNK